MVTFVQAYGLWIALALVFIAMHWFGRGCCGRCDSLRETQATRGDAGESPKGEKAGEVPSKASR